MTARFRLIHLFVALSVVPVFMVAGCARGRGVESAAELRASLQQPLETSVARNLANAPALHDVVQLAASRNPGVESKRREWLAMINTEPQELSLPDPRIVELTYDFSAGQWDSVQFMQEAPWPQKIWTRGKIAATNADTARLRYEIALRDLIIDVKNAWYELYYLDTATSITTQIAALFRNQSQLAYQQLAGGGAQLNEAFRAESQAAQLSYDLILLAEQRAVQTEELKALLNLPPPTQIGFVRAAPVYSISADIQPLYDRAEKYSQVLKIRGLDKQKAGYETHLARLSRIPDLTPQLMIEAIAEPAKTYLGQLTANLPIWEYRNRALVREKKAAEESLRLMQMDELNQVRKGVARAWFQARLSERLIDLYAQTLLPQAELAMRRAEIDFRAGTVALSSTLETTLAYQNFLLAYQRSLADHGKAIGALERVVGTTVERPADAGGEIAQ